MFCNSEKVFMSLFPAITISWPRLAITSSCMDVKSPAFGWRLQFSVSISSSETCWVRKISTWSWLTFYVNTYKLYNYNKWLFCKHKSPSWSEISWKDRNQWESSEKLRSQSPSCLCLFTQSNPFKSWKRETLFYGLEKQTLINPNRTWSSILTIQLALYKPAHAFKPPCKHNGAEC